MLSYSSQIQLFPKTLLKISFQKLIDHHGQTVCHSEKRDSKKQRLEALQESLLRMDYEYSMGRVNLALEHQKTL